MVLVDDDVQPVAECELGEGDVEVHGYPFLGGSGGGAEDQECQDESRSS